ncbi:MAG: phosphoesterase, PA-phosphatase related protein [Nocardioides sp.]|nr:phosphoesterase, PA-phosphatase related protein [Nocardioides sp.]
MSRDRSVPATALLVLVWWVAVMAVVVGVGWLITHPLAGPVDGFDNPISRWFADQRSSSLNPVADAGTLLGETVVGVGVALVAAVVFSLWQRSLRPAIFLALTEAAIGGLYFVATHLDPRDRPPVRILDAGLVPDASFPSGHVATATVAYAGVVVLVLTYARAGGLWATPLLLLPVFVLLARLYQGAHHLTDVLTSVGYAAVLLVVMARLVLPDRVSSAR